MMMPKKKKKIILIVSIVIIVLIIAIALVLLYIRTDMFKSNATLFTKYMGQAVENIDAIYQEIGTSEYEERLKHSKYTTEMQVKVNYIEGIGTTSENTQNTINQLKLKMSGQIDNNNQYNYQDINLLNNDKKVAEIEYTENQDIYGIRFSDLYQQYIAVNSEDLKELSETIGYEEIESMLDTTEIKNCFQFSEEEKQSIKATYINIINSSVSKDNFSKQKNQTIQIDGKNVNVNAYSLTLTKEQMNNMFIKILEQVKQDEIILSKIDNFQTLLEKYQFKQDMSLRDIFIENIENQITKIIRNNIGQEEVKIIIYEYYHTTIRTVIQNPEYEITIDLLSMPSENYMQISNEDKTTEKESKQVITYKKEEKETNIVFENTKNEVTTEYSLLMDETINGNNCKKTIIAKYEDEFNQVEATIEKEINIVDNFEEEMTLEKENMINLSELEEEQRQAILEQVYNQVSEKVTEITTKDVKLEDIWRVLKTMGLVKEGQTFEVSGVTETEKNRFNSKFEILEGENIESTDVLNLIDAIKENFVDIEVISNKELKLKLEQLGQNEEVVKILTTFIEENKNRKYNARVEYDEATGLVDSIILTMLEK